jgi:phosphopantothenoylcysteine decarboxylase/phosphopantothenate--cysteine ligase
MPKRIIITAGPTREALDPVRYLSNYSTGKMGYALAEEALSRGFRVTLITGPVETPPPVSVRTVKVETSDEMAEEVFSRLDKADCLIMAAAVCDYRPVKRAPHKIKKKKTLTLRLEKTIDILGSVGKRGRLIKVGFALETKDPIKNGTDKLKKKDLDMIVVNAKTAGSDPFGGGLKRCVMIGRDGKMEKIGPLAKEKIASIIMAKVGELLA